MDQQVYINGKALENPKQMQTSYIIETPERISDRVFFRYKLNIEDIQNMGNGYVVNTTNETAAKLKELSFIKSITKVTVDKDSSGSNSRGVFPSDSRYNWTVDNFGTLYIPREGDKIKLDENTLPLYQFAILNFEGNEDAKVENGKLYMNGREVSEYTFKQNYYFMMGDNRHNSLDSRYWGFVPEDHIVGKALFVWWSVDKFASWFDIGEKIRWNRLFSSID